MQPKPRPCFNPALLEDLIDCSGSVKDYSNIKYTVIASNHKDAFNYGGDLSLFEQHIKENNKEGLRKYAYACVQAIYNNYWNNHNTEATTISLVEGDALGGGFECALSSDVIIAEKGVHFGLPEVLFNMFPGMGAYSFLSRKIGVTNARKMITSGKFYSAEELYEMGVVDILAEKGEGDMAVYNYINREERSKNTYNALRKISQLNNPVTLTELQDIVDIWVDSAMNLKPRDLKMMQRIVGKQNKK